jgi:aspartate dehydrogenase
MVGCGAIGLEVMDLLKNDADLVIDRVIAPARHQDEAHRRLARFTPAPEVVERLGADLRPDFLVECAGHSAIEEHVIPALARGIPCLVVSIGALTEADLPARLEAAAHQGGTQVHLLSGAIGAIDALSAARFGGLDEVFYTGRKPSGAWKGTPAESLCDLDTLAAPMAIFEGSAREAARLYPKNANVAATLALAGLGLDQTRVQLIVDPGLHENVHHVEARGAFGSFELTMRGKPLSSNPKTSALTVYSVVRALVNRAHAIAI